MRLRRLASWVKRTAAAVLTAGLRVMWMLVGLPLLLTLVSPIVVLVFIAFAAGVGGLQFDVGVGTFEAVLVALGVAVALSALCFNYSRASHEGDRGRQVGYQCGRLLLFSAVLLVTAGTSDLMSLHPLVAETAPANTPLTVGITGFILRSTRTLSYAGAVVLASVAVMRLYAHGLVLYIESVGGSRNRSPRA